MSVISKNQAPKVDLKSEKRLPYEKPAIIYKGKITTRAGSPFHQNEEETFDLVDYLTGRNK